MLTTLRVWTDGEDWIIAESAERAHELRAASYGERSEDLGEPPPGWSVRSPLTRHLADWEALPDDRVVHVFTEHDDTWTSRTAAEWVAAEGKEGVLCSANW